MENPTIYEGLELRILPIITDPSLRSKLDEICGKLLGAKSLSELLPGQTRLKGGENIMVTDPYIVSILSMRNASNESEVATALKVIILVYTRAAIKLATEMRVEPANAADTEPENAQIYKGEELEILQSITDPSVREKLDGFCRIIVKTGAESIKQKFAEALSALDSMQTESNAQEILAAKKIVNSVFARARDFIIMTAASSFTLSGLEE